MCVWATSGRTYIEKVRFYAKIASEKDTESSNEMIFFLGRF